MTNNLKSNTLTDLRDCFVTLDDKLSKYHLFGECEEDSLKAILKEIIEKISRLELDDFNRARLSVLSILEEYKNSSIALLLVLVNNAIDSLNGKPLCDEIIPWETQYDLDQIINTYRDCLNEFAGKQIMFSDFALSIELEPTIKKQLLTHLIRMIQHINSDFAANKDDNSITSLLLLYFIVYDLCKNYNCLVSFFSLWGALIYNLNIHRMFQLARDLGEETNIRCYNDGVPEFAHLTFFRIYKDQYNLLESLFYYLLYIQAFIKKEVIVRRSFNELLQDIFALFRNSGLPYMCDRIYHSAINNLELVDYERQKWELMYFNMQMMRKDKDLPQDVFDYLNKNLENVLNYGGASARPWLTFVLNLKEIYKLSTNIDKFLQRAISSFKSCLSCDENFWIEMITSKNPQLTRKDLIQGIFQEKATRQRIDYVNEIQRLVIPAERLLESIIDENNIEDLLLCFLIVNDSSINFSEQFVPNGTLRPISVNQFSNLNDEKLVNLKDYYEKELPLQENQIAIWLFKSRGNMFYAILHQGHFRSIYPATGWTEKLTRNWVWNKLPKFFFDEPTPVGKNGVIQVRTLDDISQEIHTNLEFASIPIPKGFELLFICDLFSSTFPLNLIQNRNHQFLSQLTPVSNILNPDLFIMKDKTKEKLKLPLQLTVWAPLVDSDFTISAIYSMIEEDLKPFSPTYITDRFPQKPIQTQINVFIGHGSRGLDGFKAVFTNNEVSIRRQDRLFGTGQIAVLFICHSGALDKRIFTHQLSALAITLIEMGYQTVLASFWALHMKIPTIWLKSFLSALETGNTVSLATYKANADIRDVFPVPSAWAAMHLYGNPNLKAETDSM